MATMLEAEAAAINAQIGTDEAEQRTMRPLWWSTILCLIFLGAAWAGEHWLGLDAWVAISLYLLSYITGGYLRVVDGVKGIIEEHQLDINMLMVLGAAGAAVLGQWAEGAFLMFLFSLSAALEEYATGRTRKAIRSLVSLRPDTARLRSGDAERIVPVESLLPGDIVLVRPGDRIPVDGQILSGSSTVNQAAITGESMPVTKEAGSSVFAATLNGSGLLEVQVTKRATESTLSRIIASVEEAHEHKAKSQRLTDWIDRYYTLIVIAVALIAWVLPPLAGWDTWNGAFYRAMTLLVVMSPCALVIATPAALLSAIARAAKGGILFKGGAHLERAGLIKVVAFDKTGTLTEGKPAVTDLLPAPGVSENDLLTWAASAEVHSGHPLAQAILAEAKRRNLTLLELADVTEIAGRGVKGTLVGLGEIEVGSKRLLEGAPFDVAPFEEAGKTVVVVRGESGVLGCIALADTLRPYSAELVRGLKAQGIEKVVMLTGDNERTARAIGKQAGVDEVLAEMLPGDKLAAIQRLAQYGPVAMVGDGINDAPALAAASLGIAVGGAGNDAAIETADVVLMAADLRKVGEAIAISRQARRIVIQNLVFAVLVICTLVLFTLLDRMVLPVAVLGHEGSTILVAFNGLRMLGYKPKG